MFACFSGGDDSLASTHWAMENAPQMTDAPVRVLHINTGIGIRQTREFVRETCANYGWPLWERHAAEGEYERIVAEHGFPGSPQHQTMYVRLKQRVIEAVLREVKTHRMQRVMFVSGVYADESDNRTGYNRAVTKINAQVWVNPFYWKRCREIAAYRLTHQLQSNPVSRLYGRSGECICGAHADGIERALLQLHFPEAEAEIVRLEQVASANGHHWFWHEGKGDYHDPCQTEMFTPLCHGCGKAS